MYQTPPSLSLPHKSCLITAKSHSHSRYRNNMASLKDLCAGLPVEPLPPPRQRDNSVPHAPVRVTNLTPDEEKVSSISTLISVIMLN